MPFNTYPFFNPVHIRGRTYDLAHLNEMQLAVASERAKRDLRVRVRFTTHCYSEGFDLEVHAEDEPWIRDEGDVRRVFCPVRFKLSKGLPEIVRSLNTPEAKLHEAAVGSSWLHSTTVTSSNGPYHVFFEVRRPTAARPHRHDVELIIRSAYPQDPARHPPAVLGSMRFQVLIGNVFLGRPVKTRR